jgi:hypothetical protein
VKNEDAVFRLNPYCTGQVVVTQYRDGHQEMVVRWTDATVGIYPVAQARWRRGFRAWELLPLGEQDGRTP